ncbi:MAG: hypothetical protein E5Y10_06925 [Mesorhizobium sp.]|nr:MAG: hypothetical protein E5Y10_06925 [Mesorhizobium sp.]
MLRLSGWGRGSRHRCRRAQRVVSLDLARPCRRSALPWLRAKAEGVVQRGGFASHPQIDGGDEPSQRRRRRATAVLDGVDDYKQLVDRRRVVSHRHAAGSCARSLDQPGAISSEFAVCDQGLDDARDPALCCVATSCQSIRLIECEAAISDLDKQADVNANLYSAEAEGVRKVAGREA